ncbi:MAG: DUF1343 domain-containing protein [Ignavibacteria bacterium]|nr:DUF1343 domain-containing protein [Ignavibacteria bacterium]
MNKEHTVKIIKGIVITFFLLTNLNCYAESHKALSDPNFKLGNETLLDKAPDFKGKRVAVLTNQTGILPDGTHIIDAMIAKDFNIVKIFSPEHGIRGDENYATTDKTSLPIVSLYNGKVKPSKNDLADVDVLVYDIQDVGARFYTYTSTLYYAIEAAAESGVEMIVCDRPMITNANYTGGFMLEPAYESFVGKIPAPQAYGMTCGELASYLNNREFSGSSKLTIIPMTGYTRKTAFSTLKLTWVKPSPSMFYPSTAVCYLANCLLEGTNVSEGRGTDKPFEYFGAPWVNAQLLADELNAQNFEGVVFEPAVFTPSEKISAYPPKFFNKECSGIFINVKDAGKFDPVMCGVAILIALNRNCPEFKFNKDNFIDKLAGTDKLRKMIISGKTADEIAAAMNESIRGFNSARNEYLIYK